MENYDNPLFIGFGGTMGYLIFRPSFQHNTGLIVDGAAALWGKDALQTNVNQE